MTILQTYGRSYATENYHKTKEHQTLHVK